MKIQGLSKSLTALSGYGLGLLLAGTLTLTSNAAVKAQPGNSSSFGKSLAEWQQLYQR